MNDKTMTKEEIIELVSLFSLVMASEDGYKVIAFHFDDEAVDKMIKVYMHLFDEKEQEAEKFVVNKMKALLKKLDDFKL